MADNIDKINRDKTAIFGKIYYDNYNNAYVGTRNGRLEKLRTETISATRNIKSDSTSDSWDFKKLSYDSSDNIILIEEFKGGSLLVSKTLSYDINGNITKITSSYDGKVREKSFSYDTNDNIKTITIK